MNEENQYCETLISLVELNQDKTWLKVFYSLRDGKHLPGGGTGSLNDWGPCYLGMKKQAWYSTLYEMIRFIVGSYELTSKLEEFKYNRLAYKNYLRKCLGCGRFHINPSITERCIAIEFYKKYIPRYIKRNCLVDIISSELSYNSNEVNKLRTLLNIELLGKKIELFNFRNSEIICPHCEENDIQIETNEYLHLDMNTFEIKELSILKQ